MTFLILADVSTSNLAVVVMTLFWVGHVAKKSLEFACYLSSFLLSLCFTIITTCKGTPDTQDTCPSLSSYNKCMLKGVVYTSPSKLTILAPISLTCPVTRATKHQSGANTPVTWPLTTNQWRALHHVVHVTRNIKPWADLEGSNY